MSISSSTEHTTDGGIQAALSCSAWGDLVQSVSDKVASQEVVLHKLALHGLALVEVA